MRSREDSMQPLERPTQGPSFRTGVPPPGVGSAPQVSIAADTNLTAVRPFRVAIPENELVELRRRLAATRWPTRELVRDRSQGVQLATLKELVRYWSTEYD